MLGVPRSLPIVDTGGGGKEAMLNVPMKLWTAIQGSADVEEDLLAHLVVSLCWLA